MWQSQGNARVDLCFPNLASLTQGFVKGEGLLLILRAVVLVLSVPEPDGYGDLGLA